MNSRFPDSGVKQPKKQATADELKIQNVLHSAAFFHLFELLLILFSTRWRFFFEPPPQFPDLHG